MSSSLVPDPNLFDELKLWLKAQGKSQGTILNYCYALSFKENPEIYFGDSELEGRRLKIFAFRSYLKFLAKKKGVISRVELMDALETFKPRIKRGNNHSEKKWSIPKDYWVNCIRSIPTKVGKMGVWIGFHFGLRLKEILHLRIQDINFEENLILIRAHSKSRQQEAWYPKYNRERQIPITQEQASTFRRWIEEIRPKELLHNYLLWTERGPRKNQILQTRAFQRWLNKVEYQDKKLHAHVLRYSFATHWYYKSKDVKLISELLGHASVSTTSEYLQLGQKEIMEKARTLFEQS